METTTHASAYVRQRRFLVILPLLTLPFITLMFWAFGGGKNADLSNKQNRQQGLNLNLPDAKLSNAKALNKLSFYQQAASEASKAKEAEKLDPYWRKDSGVQPESNYGYSLSDGGMDVNQVKVYNKLDELKKVLNQPGNNSLANQTPTRRPYSMLSYSSSDDVDRLHAMMQNMKEDKTADPDITQLNDMLDKIQAIQNPDMSGTNKKHTGKSLAVTTRKNQADISLLKPDINKSHIADTGIIANSNNGFYGTSVFDTENDSTLNNSIEAVIPETQTIVAGATIKLALRNDVTIQDVVLPSGTSLYGTTSLSDERLKISVTSIHFQKAILPVTLNVYDIDGQEGIYMPGSINRTVAKESANNAIGGMNLTTVDGSASAQAASAGIEAARKLLSKKVKLIKMTVRAGYKVLLKDKNDK